MKRIYIFLLASLMACFFVAKPVKAETLINTRQIVAQVNDLRQQSGQKQLTVDKDLVDAANQRAYEASKKWSHTRPDGSAWYTVNPAIVGGENLAYTETVEEVVQMWKDSPEHLDNILYGEFKTTGIGYYVDGNTVYVAQLFGY